MWDSAGVSTGPIVRLGDKCLMVYNGRDSSRTWAIGEVVFDPGSFKIERRSEKPIIVPPPGEIGWKDQYMAFSSGALVEGDKVYLYYHLAHLRIHCAVGRLESNR